MAVLGEQRKAIARANLFLQMAEKCHIDNANEFEAFIEATIIFARSSIQRLQKQHEKHPAFKSWWNGLNSNQAVQFFRVERNWILKDGPAKLGQRVLAPCIGAAETPANPMKAGDLYFYEKDELVTRTLARHLQALEQLLDAASTNFS